MRMEILKNFYTFWDGIRKRTGYIEEEQTEKIIWNVFKFSISPKYLNQIH